MVNDKMQCTRSTHIVVIEWISYFIHLFIYCPGCPWLGFTWTRSSIRKIVIAASVANRRDLIFDIAGSTTPAAKLSLISPSMRSSPYVFKTASSALRWLLACIDRNFETNSALSFAALTANVLGITNKASAVNAAKDSAECQCFRNYQQSIGKRFNSQLLSGI